MIKKAPCVWLNGFTTIDMYNAKGIREPVKVPS